MKKHGPAFGYHLTKCHIITEENLFEKAQQIFVHDEVEIVDGFRVLDSVIGSDNAEKNCGKITKTAEIAVDKLAAHANVSPQNVYKLFTSSDQHSLTFLARKTSNIKDLLKEGEISINNELITTL